MTELAIKQNQTNGFAAPSENKVGLDVFGVGKQSSQLKAQVFLHDKSRRQELYREFVDEASNGYIDSITSKTPDLTRHSVTS
jgi:hypothetical protein